MKLTNPETSLRKEVHNFIIDWNNKFPIDRWWRIKHNIAFGSVDHRNANFIQMFLEYEEDEMIRKLSDRSDSQETSEFDLGDGEKMSQSEIDEEFDNLDIDKFNG